MWQFFSAVGTMVVVLWLLDDGATPSKAPPKQASELVELQPAVPAAPAEPSAVAPENESLPAKPSHSPLTDPPSRSDPIASDSKS